MNDDDGYFGEDVAARYDLSDMFDPAVVDPVVDFLVERAGSDDVEIEYARLSGLGVVFTQAPLTMGPVTTAVFDDTCGNLIQIAQRK